MVKYIIISLIVLVRFDAAIRAQSNPFCGTDEYEDMLWLNPTYQSHILKEEKAYRSYIRNPPSYVRNNQVTLPVVFHIIHDHGEENISDDQVLQGLDYLNEAFSNEGPYQNDHGIDTKIRFCLAQRDEYGEAFSGIIRYDSPYTDMSIFEGFDYVLAQKLDSTQYINIQIVKNACLGSRCDVTGFAGEHRVVVEAQKFNGHYQDASILIHEVGHYLGLKHTFHGGCKNDNCLTDGDRVCDTPPDNRTLDGCSNPSNSCSTDENDISDHNPYRPLSLGGMGDQEDMKTNFMDYNFRSCRDHFTQGQADRMHFFISHSYASLLTSQVCLPPCEDVVIADFMLPDSIAIGSTLTVGNQSINADSYQWYIDGNPVSNNQDLEYTFLQEGILTVQLEAYTSDTLCVSDVISKSINVICPITACFDYQIQEQYLIWEDCSENAESLGYTIKDGAGDSIYSSQSAMDSLYINNVDFLQLCIHATGEYCDDQYCENITITSDGSEICGNEQDDDGDGLIDLFDPDCPCEDRAYQANCPSDCEIIPDSFPDIKMKMKWESIRLNDHFISGFSTYTVGDVDGDGQVEILSNYGRGGVNNSTNYISVINSTNGYLIDSVQIYPEYNSFEIPVYPAIFRFSINNNISIYTGQSGDLVCLDGDGNESFRTNHPSALSKPSITDFNADGNPEIFSGNVIFNGETGSILFVGLDVDCFSNGNCRVFQPIVADVIGNDNIPELITGKHVYQLDITNLTGTIGNNANITIAPSGIEDGRCAVSDIDGDGNLDIIVVEPSYSPDMITGALSIWNPRTNTTLAHVSNPLIDDFNFSGGMPFVGDVDGDCSPEIGVVYKRLLRMYKYIDGIGLEILYDIPTSDESGFTGVTMFDFNQDGKQELVYRDETSLRIFEGATGATLDSFPLFSGTGSEYPIVADVDNDGQAEIIVSGSRTSQDEVRMYCFESATTPWAPARSVWNQYAYNPTQVNDDLTIPRYQQNAAQPLQGTENCPRETCNTPYNNFMVQATMRTQEGCYVWPELQRDLSITAESRCVGDSLEICFYTSSTDTTTVSQGVTINCYPPPWDEGNGEVIQSIDEIVVTNDTTCIMMPMLTDIDSLLIVVNDDGGYYPPDFPNSDIAECDYTNNEFVLQIGGPDFSIDIIDWECSTDSLIFYIATDNVGIDTDVSCIGGGCYFFNPLDYGMDFIFQPLEITTWCFDYDTISMTYQYQDTFRVAIPHPPLGEDEMWWSINEGGFAPGILSSEVTGIYECDYENNMDGISFDLLEKVLDLGPDIIKCNTEIFTLNAGVGFESYLWNDLTTDSIYSAIEEGIHYVEATDQCGRVYRDTILVTIHDIDAIDLGDDFSLCYDQDTVLTISGDYDEVHWIPSEMVACDTCMSTSVSVDSMSTFIIQARKENCIYHDTITIDRIIAIRDTMMISACVLDTIDFYDEQISSDGTYEYLSDDCSSLHVLQATFASPDTTLLFDQICSSDSIWFDGDYLDADGLYEMTTQNILGCDSTVVLDLAVVSEFSVSDTLHICSLDSIQVFGEWIYNDTIVQQMYVADSGCDSIHSFTVLSSPHPENDFQYEICEGDSVLLYNEWYSIEGEYNLQISASEGCDSLISIEIITKENFASYDTIVACRGDTVQVFDVTLIDDDDIWEYYDASNGCDSISYYHVDFVEELASSEDIILCPSDSIMINGSWIHSAGEYETIHQSTLGCDSIHIITVELVDNPPIPTTMIDCEQLDIIVSIDDQSNWNPIWSNGDTTYWTTYTSSIIEAGLTLYSQPNCEKQFTITLPLVPEIDEFSALSDTTIQEGQSLTLDLGLNPNEWIVLWSDATVVDCDTCFLVNLQPTENTKITVFLQHQSGCSYESTFNIVIEEDQHEIYVPNVFSPNGDGSNDAWTVYTSPDIHIIACSIYDRWGNLVFNSSARQPSWDGSVNGSKYIQGVYVYAIEFIDQGGNIQSKVGDLTLIR